MMKQFLLSLLCIFIFSCGYKGELSYIKAPVGQKRVTANKNIPVIYENGFQSALLIPVSADYKVENETLEELRFMNSSHSMYIKEGMFTRFGVWQDCIIRENPSHPALIWKKKLFPEHNIEFTVIADGEEIRDYIYSCVQVLYSGKDALAKESPYRKELVIYFSKMITSSSDNPNFYTFYYKHKCSG
jgi:hypothetical protein